MTRYLQRSWFSLVLFRTKCTTMPVQSPLGQVLCAQSSLPSQCFNVESEPDKCCSSARRFCESVMIRKNSLVSDISMPPGISLSQLVVKFKLVGQGPAGPGRAPVIRVVCEMANCLWGLQVAKVRFSSFRATLR